MAIQDHADHAIIGAEIHGFPTARRLAGAGETGRRRIAVPGLPGDPRPVRFGWSAPHPVSDSPYPRG